MVEKIKNDICNEIGNDINEIPNDILKKLSFNKIRQNSIKYAEKETSENFEQLDRMTFMKLKERINEIISNYSQLTLKYIEVVSIKHENISNKSSGASSSSSNLKSLRNDFLKIKF